MPIYVYKFLDTGETIEVQQSFSDDTLTEYTHPDTGAVLAVKKVFQPVGVTFKGSGFFKTDNRGKSSSSSSSDSTGGSSNSDSSPSKGESGSGGSGTTSGSSSTTASTPSPTTSGSSSSSSSSSPH